MIRDIRDKYELCLCIGHSHFAGLRERPMEHAGEAVVQDGEDEEGIVQQGQHHLDYYFYYYYYYYYYYGEDEEGIVQQGQHHLPITITNKNLYEFFSKLKMKTRKKQFSLSSRANTTCR